MIDREGESVEETEKKKIRTRAIVNDNKWMIFHDEVKRKRSKMSLYQVPVFTCESPSSDFGVLRVEKWRGDTHIHTIAMDEWDGDRVRQRLGPMLKQKDTLIHLQPERTKWVTMPLKITSVVGTMFFYFFFFKTSWVYDEYDFFVCCCMFVHITFALLCHTLTFFLFASNFWVVFCERVRVNSRTHTLYELP